MDNPPLTSNTVPSDISRRLTGEIGIGLGDVLGLAQAAQGHAFDEHIADLGRDGGRHRGGDEAGATALTRMPLGPSSRAQVLVMPITPALAAA